MTYLDDSNKDSYESNADSIINDCIISTNYWTNEDSAKSTDNQQLNNLRNHIDTLTNEVSSITGIISNVKNDSIHQVQHDQINYQNESNENEIPHLVDYIGLQKQLKHQLQYLPIDYATISSIKLLKIMMDGQISACHYTSIAKWYEEFMLSQE